MKTRGVSSKTQYIIKETNVSFRPTVPLDNTVHLGHFGKVFLNQSLGLVLQKEA